MCISNKEASIESLPLKLILTCIVAAITISIVWSAFSNYYSAHFENEFRTEIDYIINTIKQVYACGNNSSLKISAHLSNIEYVKIGASIYEPESSLIIYKLSGSTEERVQIISDSIVKVTCSNATLLLYSGRYTLFFTHINYDRDKNGKIDSYERYVEVYSESAGAY